MRKAILAAVALGILVAAVTLVGCGKKLVEIPDTVAKVNGQEISAATYLDQLHRSSGQRVLQTMIEQQIIVQWAKDEGVPPTEEQVKSQIDALKRDGDYEERVKALGEEGLRQQAEVQQAVTNLAVKLYKIKDKELQEAYDMRRTNYVHGPRKRVALIIDSDKKRIDAAAKKIKAGQDFDEVASSSGVQNPFGPTGAIKTWIEPDQAGLPEDLSEAAKKTKTGKVSGVIKLTAPPGAPASYTQYAILKVIGQQPKADIKMKQVKNELANVAAVQKIQAESADFQKKLNARKKRAKVQVNIEQFKGIVGAVTNPPEPQATPQMAPRPTPR